MLTGCWLLLQEDMLDLDEDLDEELAPLKEALERAVHRKNEAISLKEQFEDEVRHWLHSRPTIALSGSWARLQVSLHGIEELQHHRRRYVQATNTACSGICCGLSPHVSDCQHPATVSEQAAFAHTYINSVYPVATQAQRPSITLINTEP